jgi:dihydroorotate dehydrogenase
MPPAGDPLLRQEVWGLTFSNPIGLAAGFDKNCELPRLWPALGFGFAELGTVTAQAQPGNERPRLFRLTADRALINRLGFNNDGAQAIARSLARRLRRGRPPIPLGLNLGKSRATPLADAAGDYLLSFRLLWPLADYVAINVSSPNTPGLRDLQSEAQLEPLLRVLRDENERCAAAHRAAPRPLLLKVSPDLDAAGLASIVRVALHHKVAGLIATNTTIARAPLRASASLAQQEGGLSGAPLRDRSTEVIRLLYRLGEGQLPIIGVGGIFTAADAYAKIRAGASLLQVYTGFIYEGPSLPRRLAAGLGDCLRRDGFSTIADAVGRDAAAGPPPAEAMGMDQ